MSHGTTQSLVSTLGLVVALTALAGCGGVDVVDAGAYEGVVDEARPGEKEIYVVLDDGGKLELYFTDETVLEQAGEPVAFAKLEAGTRVRVTVTRDGNRNVPTRVEILS